MSIDIYHVCWFLCVTESELSCHFEFRELLSVVGYKLLGIGKRLQLRGDQDQGRIQHREGAK